MWWMYWPGVTRAWTDKLFLPYHTCHFFRQNESFSLFDHPCDFSFFDHMDTANLSGRFSRTKRMWWMHRPRLPWVWSDLLTFNLSFLSFLSYFPAKGCQHSPLFSLASVNYCKFTFFECTNRANLLVRFGRTKRIWWLSCHSLFWMSSFAGKHEGEQRACSADLPKLGLIQAGISITPTLSC